MSEKSIEDIVSRLTELDEALNEIKEHKKKIDEEVKELEAELIIYCQENKKTVENVTQGTYNVKPSSGRRLKKK
jgi:chromosome segregation ATPase